MREYTYKDAGDLVVLAVGFTFLQAIADEARMATAEALLTFGIGALQVLLDKGQEDDWFGSRFITALTVVAVVCPISLVIWEWFQKAPIIDVRMFKNFTLHATIAAPASAQETAALMTLWEGQSASHCRRTEATEFMTRLIAEADVLFSKY